MLIKRIFKLVCTSEETWNVTDRYDRIFPMEVTRPIPKETSQLEKIPVVIGRNFHPPFEILENNDVVIRLINTEDTNEPGNAMIILNMAKLYWRDYDLTNPKFQLRSSSPIEYFPSAEVPEPEQIWNPGEWKMQDKIFIFPPECAAVAEICHEAQSETFRISQSFYWDGWYLWILDWIKNEEGRWNLKSRQPLCYK